MGYAQAIKTVDKALTVGTDAYTANDVVGGLITIDVHSSGGSGQLRRINIIDDDDEKAALTVYLFDQQPSTIADDAAFAPTVADLKKMIGVVSVVAGDYTTLNSNAHAIKDGLGIDFAAPDGNLYAYVVCTGTPTYTAAGDLTLRFTAWVD